MPRLQPDQLQHTFWGGSQDKLFPKADQVVPMCSQDCSKLLTLVASAPSEGPWGRSTKSVSMVYSVATLPESKARALLTGSFRRGGLMTHQNGGGGGAGGGLEG